MNGDVFFKALDLPTSCGVGQRVPKKLLLENAAPTSADKRRINEGIEELFWLAALKPSTIGVPATRDSIREYLEIAVLRLSLRAEAKTTRLVELVHRAIPYPVLLLTEQDGRAGLSCAHKRWSQGEAGQTVLDTEVVSVEWQAEHDTAYKAHFLEALALGRQPRGSQYALYQGWMDTLLALQAARLTGIFTTISAEHATIRREALRECARLEAEMARLRIIASKEKQVAKQVALNLELKRVETQWEQARTRL